MKILSKIIIVFVLLINNALGEIVNKLIFLRNQIPDETIIMFSNINLNENINNDKLNLILKNLYDSNFLKIILLI